MNLNEQMKQEADVALGVVTSPPPPSIMIKTLTVLALLAVIVGGYWMFTDPGYIPILDRNRTLLGDSERDGFCAGVVYWETSGRGNQDSMKKCVETNTLDDTVRLDVVQLAFCLGAQSEGFDGNVQTDCLEILQREKLWPTMVGTLSNSWDDNYPYPGDTFTARRATPGRTDTQDTGDREVDDGAFR